MPSIRLRYSALHNAADHGHAAMVELLLSYGAAVNAKIDTKCVTHRVQCGYTIVRACMRGVPLKSTVAPATCA